MAWIHNTGNKSNIIFAVDHRRVAGDGDTERRHRLHRAESHLPLPLLRHGAHASLWILLPLYRSTLVLQLPLIAG
jgi:hypothetical protein